MLVNEKKYEKEWVESILIALMEDTVVEGIDLQKSLSECSEKILKHFEEV
ncbi:hypothetical protein [Leptospira sp. 'Mane']